MNDDMIKDLLNKLLELTKNNSIEWDYLDNNKAVCEALESEGLSSAENRSPIKMFSYVVATKKVFDSDNSFIAKINGNYVIIYCNITTETEAITLDERLIFMLVPRTFKDIYKYCSDGNDGTLLRLQSLVKSKFPNANDIANDILSM